MLFAAFSLLHQRNGSYNSVNLLAKISLGGLYSGQSC